MSPSLRPTPTKKVMNDKINLQKDCGTWIAIAVHFRQNSDANAMHRIILLLGRIKTANGLLEKKAQ